MPWAKCPPHFLGWLPQDVRGPEALMRSLGLVQPRSWQEGFSTPFVLEGAVKHLVWILAENGISLGINMAAKMFPSWAIK